MQGGPHERTTDKATHEQDITDHKAKQWSGRRRKRRSDERELGRDMFRRHTGANDRTNPSNECGGRKEERKQGRKKKRKDGRKAPVEAAMNVKRMEEP